MSLIQSMKRIPDIFGSLMEAIFDRILSLATNSISTRVDFVYETYPDVGIKNLEWSKRANASSTHVRILGSQQKVPKQSVGKNIESLIEFFLEHHKNVERLSTICESFFFARLTENQWESHYWRLCWFVKRPWRSRYTSFPSRLTCFCNLWSYHRQKSQHWCLYITLKP